MEPATLLLRQVNPGFLKPDGTAASPAFRPFPRDDGQLSVDDGSKVTPRQSWETFTGRPKCFSAGVWAFSVAEAAAQGLSAAPDSKEDNPAHALVDFRPFLLKEQEAKAKILAARANARGPLFQPPASAGTSDS